mgnify:CR=1 FL=1
MGKIEIESGVFLPMPVVLVGADVDGRPNFMAAGWVSRVDFDPALVAVSLTKGRHTAKGIVHNGGFSLCFPSRDLVQKTDYCGLVSGKDTDKSGVFEVTYGKLPGVPLAAECPLCVECRLIQTVTLDGSDIFIGEMVAAYADEDQLSQGAPDAKKMNLFFLTMPDNKYWCLGDEVADAYSVGKGLIAQG